MEIFFCIVLIVPHIAMLFMYIAFDYGRKRVGVAVAHASVAIAHPRDALRVTNFDDAVRQAIALIVKEEATDVIIGRPVSGMGKTTEITEEVEEFASALERQRGVRIFFVDERFSTQEMEKAGVKKEAQDSAVAAVLLQNYFSARAG